MRALKLSAALVLVILPCGAWAHVDAASSREAGELLLISLLLLSGAWYAYGYWRVWQASGAGRDVLLRRGSLFAFGWLTIAASLLSPLHQLGGRSFTAHMIEHELLMLLAAPLMALSRPIGVLLWAFPRAVRRSLGNVGRNRWFSAFWTHLSSPLSASLLQAAMLWIWHAPVFFDRALASESWHAAQHLSLLFSALLFWWSINSASALERKHGVAGFFLFFTSIHSGLLGALMAFAKSPWYSQYVAMGMSGVGGLTPLEDQQIAGLIMWVPGGAVHAIAALIYLSRWFKVPRKAVTTTALVLLVATVAGIRPVRADTVYVSNEGSNVVHVIDGAAGKVIGQMAVGRRPRGMALSNDAKTLYVAVSDDNRIDVVDLASQRVIGELPSGPDPEVIALHPDGAHVFVANEADSQVSIVDIAQRKIIAEVPVGAEPEGMAISPDGSLALCTSESSSMAHFIATRGDPSQPELLDNVMVDTRPRYAMFTADSRQVWVSSELRATVAVFDTATRRRTGRIDFEQLRPDLQIVQAIGIQIMRDGSRAFIALGRANLVAEVDPANLAVLRYFPTGSRVWNIALAPDESRLYAAAGLSGELTLIDLHSNQPTATLALGGKPWGIVVAP
jgi:PQQ-dependent catabolism-associated beta-propeller protein